MGERDDSRSKQMARARQLNINRANAITLPPIKRRKLLQTSTHIGYRVQRARRFVFAVIEKVRAAGFLFKQMCAVEQHDFSQIAARFCADDLTAKTVSHQHWQVAAVVEVSMAENAGIYVAWHTGKGAQLRKFAACPAHTSSWGFPETNATTTFAIAEAGVLRLTAADR